MPFPDFLTSEGFETFFEPTRVWLFGKHYNSLEYVRNTMDEEFVRYKTPAPGDDLPIPPRRIERALRRGETENKTPIFARIYSFSYEGHYYNLPRPLLFLVYGAGNYIDPKSQTAGKKPTTTAKDKAAAAKAAAEAAADLPQGQPPQVPDPESGHVAFNTKFTGVDARSWYFSDDIRVWAVDRRDLAVCLDVEIGSYQEILLSPMASRGGGGGSSRSDMVSRSDMTSRSDMVGRSDMVSRGSSAFRSDMVGPHQNW